VTQRQTTEAVTNAVVNGTASFFADGYAYNLWANNFYPAPASDVVTNGSAKTLPYPGATQQDPNVVKALDAAIAQLAPGIGAQCFYRQVQGTWADLSAMGIGDPRSGIPSALTEGNFQLNKYEQPAAGCAAGVAPDPHQFGPTFNAMFGDSKTFLNISANAVAPGDPTNPGFVGEDMANWSNGKFYFYVSGQGPSLSPDIIRSIASALDPNFPNACFVNTKAIAPGDVSGLGVQTPAAPNGFRLDNANLTSNESTAACGTGTAAVKGYNLLWTFFPTGGIGNGGLIEAGASLGATSPNGSPGFVTETSLAWQDDHGTRFHVTGFKGDVPRDTLLAVAKSMDPNFSESRLQAAPIGVSGSGSSASTGVAVSPAAPRK
jgi:hypothetical protein